MYKLSDVLLFLVSVNNAAILRPRGRAGEGSERVMASEEKNADERWEERLFR